MITIINCQTSCFNLHYLLFVSTHALPRTFTQSNGLIAYSFTHPINRLIANFISQCANGYAFILVHIHVYINFSWTERKRTSVSLKTHSVTCSLMHPKIGRVVDNSITGASYPPLYVYISTFVPFRYGTDSTYISKPNVYNLYNIIFLGIPCKKLSFRYVDIMP